VIHRSVKPTSLVLEGGPARPLFMSCPRLVLLGFDACSAFRLQASDDLFLRMTASETFSAFASLQYRMVLVAGFFAFLHRRPGILGTLFSQQRTAALSIILCYLACFFPISSSSPLWEFFFSETPLSFLRPPLFSLFQH